jgi:transcriptional regulator with XRE-family HTH domain
VLLELAKIVKDEEIRKAFGKRLKELRKQKAWTQKDLATKVDIPFSLLNKYEGGFHVPPVEKLLLFADLFDTSLDYLLAGNATENRPLHNVRLLDRFRALEAFPGEDQETVIRVIDALVCKHQVEGAMRPFEKRREARA